MPSPSVAFGLESPLLNGSPGSPGRVCVLGFPEERGSPPLPAVWDVVVARALEDVGGLWRSCAVFVVWPGAETCPWVVEALQYLADVQADAPVLVRAAGRTGVGDELAGVLAFDFRTPLWPDHLAGKILNVLGRSAVLSFGDAVQGIACPPRILRAGIRFLVRQPLLPEVEAVEALARGEVVFVRSVADLAERLGCSPQLLRRQAKEAGIRLAVLVRWATVLQALGAYGPGSSPWSSVAPRLGFSDVTALSHFFKRTTGERPRALAAHPWRVLVVRALEAAVVRGRGVSGGKPDTRR